MTIDEFWKLGQQTIFFHFKVVIKYLYRLSKFDMIYNNKSLKTSGSLATLFDLKANQAVRDTPVLLSQVVPTWRCYFYI